MESFPAEQAECHWQSVIGEELEEGAIGSETCEGIRISTA